MRSDDDIINHWFQIHSNETLYAALYDDNISPYIIDAN